MKILFVGSQANLDLTRIGGIENTVKELVYSLIKYGHQVTVFIIKDGKTVTSEIKIENISIPIIFAPKNIVRKELFNDYSIINFIQTPFESPFFFIRFLFYKWVAKPKTIKFFFTYPSLAQYTFFQKMKLKLLIDITIVFSNRLRDLAEKITGNVKLLYPPIASHYYVHSKGNRGEKVKILFVGRLSYDKGLDIVLDVYKNLSRDKFHCSIWGYFANEKEKFEYEALLQEGFIDEVKIANHANNAEMNYLPLGDYDILLLPYQDLGPTLDTPLLVLEGLASGCKVITSAIISLESLSNLYLVKEYQSPQKYLEAIEKYAATEVHRIDLSKYSSDKLVENYLDTIK